MSVEREYVRYIKELLKDKNMISLYEAMLDLKSKLSDFESTYGSCVDHTSSFLRNRLLRNSSVFMTMSLFRWNNSIADMLSDVIPLMVNYYAHYNFPDTPFFLRGEDQLYSYFSKTLDDKEKKKFTEFVENVILNIDFMKELNDANITDYTQEHVDRISDLIVQIKSKDKSTLTKEEYKFLIDACHTGTLFIVDDRTRKRQQIIEFFYYFHLIDFIGMRCGNNELDAKEENRFLKTLKKVKNYLLEVDKLSPDLTEYQLKLKELDFNGFFRFLYDDKQFEHNLKILTEICRRLELGDESDLSEPESQQGFDDIDEAESLLENNEFFANYQSLVEKIRCDVVVTGLIRGFYYNQTVYCLNKQLGEELVSHEFNSEINLDMLRDKQFVSLTVDISNLDLHQYIEKIEKLKPLADHKPIILNFTPIFVIQDGDSKDGIDCKVENQLLINILYRKDLKYFMTLHTLSFDDDLLKMSDEEKFAVRMLNILLYYFSDNADISPRYVSHSTGKTTKKHKNKVKLEFLQNKISPEHFSETPRIMDIGENVGKRIAKVYERINNPTDHSEEQETEKVGTPKRPHVRAGHYHQYWKGKRDSQDRKLITHYLETTFVNMSKEEL